MHQKKTRNQVFFMVCKLSQMFQFIIYQSRKIAHKLIPTHKYWCSSWPPNPLHLFMVSMKRASSFCCRIVRQAIPTPHITGERWRNWWNCTGEAQERISPQTTRNNHKANLNSPRIYHISPFLNHEDSSCNRLIELISRYATTSIWGVCQR